MEWENHKGSSASGNSEYDQADEITKSLDLLKRQVEECQKAILSMKNYPGNR
ncbi:MAG: hypothetical protein ACLVG5_10040 [Clostridium sp.]